ncbi:SDR family oxidoreductase [Prauserella isguenensis]|nr:SDR family oxidoreductase [Prauserella isguenensis]
MSILVTGGTGTLGSAVVDRLADGYDVRVLSRASADGRRGERRRYERMRGDLRTGAGIAAAVAGVDVVVHCATTNGRGDVPATRNLLDAARRAGGPHVVYVSIAGSDRIPLPYYRAKQECEGLVERSGLRWTILRTTQFHDLIATFFAVQRWLPVVAVPAGVDFQPIDVRDVAERLAELAAEPAAGRAADLGGPRIRSTRDLARTYLQVTGRRRLVVPLPPAGGTLRGYREGRHLVPDNAAGRRTFDDFLAEAVGTGWGA